MADATPTPTSIQYTSLRKTAPGHEIWLIWGGNGWIAGHLYDLLKNQKQTVMTSTVRMEDREAVLRELDAVAPTHVLNCAGVTGRPNVDWCEDHREETIRSNAIGTLNLADCCFLRNIHCTVFATGCIYQYDATHPMGNPHAGFLETDPPNFTGSFYSFTKSHTEALLKSYPNTLVLRLRMPVSDDLHPRSFLTKITTYAHIASTPNSHTILSTLLPASLLLAAHAETGVYNFTNPGAVSHNEVLELYRKHIDPAFAWENFSLEAQSRVIKAGRSNCLLDAGKLVRKLGEWGVDVPEVREAYEACFARMKVNIGLGTDGGEEGTPATMTTRKGVDLGKENAMAGGAEAEMV